MDMHQLRSFVAVAQMGTLTLAAETLFLSQPALTAHIKSMERELEVDLFKRSSGGMKLTRAGEAFLPYAEKAIKGMVELESFGATLAAKYTDEIIIGVVDPLPVPKLARFIQKFSKMFPDTRIHVRFGVTGSILNKVRTREHVFGFAIGESPMRNIREIPLQKIRYHLVAPLEFKDRIDPENVKSIEKLPWIDMPDYAAGHEIARAFWKKSRINPETRIESDRNVEILYLVGAGIGISLIPDNIVAQGEKLGIEILHYENWYSEETMNFVYSSELEDDPKVLEAENIAREIWLGD